MYSGTEFHNKSGAILGAHQKIDRVARRNVRKLGVEDDEFPAIKQILYFEGKNGPDGIKVKSPAQNEPWHYIDPFDEDDTQLLEQIEMHYDNLTTSLKRKDLVSAAFQAAWLAHALVDGLTPAHHFPYEEAIEELRGDSIETRTTYKDKLFFPGDSKSETLKKNWKMWGVDGVLTRHIAFEVGISAFIAPLRLNTSLPSNSEFKMFKENGIRDYYMRNVRHIAMLDLYNRFYESGWTNKLVRDARNELAPTMARVVSVFWYMAHQSAKK